MENMYRQQNPNNSNLSQSTTDSTNQSQSTNKNGSSSTTAIASTKKAKGFKQMSFIQLEAKVTSKVRVTMMPAMMGFMIEPMMLLSTLMFHPF
jgi:hypothetical protein